VRDKEVGMDPARLHLWEGWDPTGSPADGALADAPLVEALTSRAEDLYLAESLWRKLPPGERPEPFAPRWFLDLENARHGRYGKWIPRLLEFAKHPGETLLCVGRGLGTDWVQYARHGARVVACCSSAEDLALVRRNFSCRNLRAAFLYARAEELPVEAASIDVVCLNDLGGSPDPVRVVGEVYRVLKPGGKVLAVVPAHFDVDFWTRRCLPWKLLRRHRHGQPELRFGARQLRKLFGTFTEHRIHKRHLRRAEIPQLWRLLPLPLLERLFGRFLILKAFKAVSTVQTDGIARAA
jgi:ubiquinone/menaquinone biosynthesis C-methylase UbiE